MEIDVFNNYKVDYDKLIKYGFKKEKDEYVYKIDVDNDLYAVFSLNKKICI